MSDLKQNALEKRETFKPKGITCPEGIWILEAVFLSDEKRYGEDAGKQKIGDGVTRLIEVLVTNPEIDVFTISSFGGEKEPINRNYLRGREPTKDFLRGFIPYSNGFQTSKDEGRFIFVNKEHFENYLADKPIDDSPLQDEEIQGMDSYIPAYLELMLKAVKALNLSLDKRANMDDITSWLDENWPSNLDGKSDRIIKSMATLLRRPEDKKGGNTPWK